MIIDTGAKCDSSKPKHPTYRDAYAHEWQDITMWMGMNGWGPTTLLSKCVHCGCTKRSLKPLTNDEQQCLKAAGIGNGAGTPSIEPPDGRDKLPCSVATSFKPVP